MQHKYNICLFCAAQMAHPDAPMDIPQPQPSIQMTQPVAPTFAPQQAIPMAQPTMGVPQPSMQMPQTTVVVPQPSMQMPQTIVSVPQPSMQMGQPTPVVFNQPQSIQNHGLPPATRDWSSGICGCFDDFNICK